jgi:hypothetical protein
MFFTNILCFSNTLDKFFGSLNKNPKINEPAKGNFAGINFNKSINQNNYLVGDYKFKLPLEFPTLR